ncbi:MAG: trypsin-like peptidase domain-containing protein, partial [Thermoflexales bacterium]
MLLFRKKLCTHVLVGAVITVGAALVPAQAVMAQSAPQVRGLPDFTDLVELVGPAVVNIRTLERARPAAGGNGQMDEEMQEFFRRFFGQPPPGAPGAPGAPRAPRPNRPQQPEEDVQPRGVGSGFILTSDGYVMTNAHVVDGAEEVLVTLPDKREFKARVIGTPDKRSDVAVIKIEATGLPSVKIGDVGR